MGEATGTAQHSRRAKGGALCLTIDPETVSLDSKTVVVKHTRDGGYLCLGFGPPAAFLQKIDRDPNFGEANNASDAAIGKFRVPFMHGEDPFLRRLGSAVALAKDFDPEQPRDDDGRWTSGGAGAVATRTAIATDIIAPSEFVPALRQIAARLLPAVPAAASGAVAFFGTLFIPTNRSLISDGAVPDAPDLGYSFDQGTGVLTLRRTGEDGSKDVLFSGRYGSDGLFRDGDGNVIGRHLGGSVVIDPDAVPGYQSRAKGKERSGAGAEARTDAATDNANRSFVLIQVRTNQAGQSDRSARLPIRSKFRDCRVVSPSI